MRREPKRSEPVSATGNSWAGGAALQIAPQCGHFAAVSVARLRFYRRRDAAPCGNRRRRHPGKRLFTTRSPPYAADLGNERRSTILLHDEATACLVLAAVRPQKGLAGDSPHASPEARSRP